MHRLPPLPVHDAFEERGLAGPFHGPSALANPPFTCGAVWVSAHIEVINGPRDNPQAEKHDSDQTLPPKHALNLLGSRFFAIRAELGSQYEWPPALRTVARRVRNLVLAIGTSL